VEEGGGTDFPVGSRVMFTGPYGVLRTEPTVSGLPYGRKASAGYPRVSTM